MPTADIAQRFLSLPESAQYAGVSADTLRRLIAGGKLRGIRPVPGRLLLDRLEIDKVFIASTALPERPRGRRSVPCR